MFSNLKLEEIILFCIAICFAPVLIWMLFSGIWVKTVFNKFDKVSSAKNINAKVAVRMLLDKQGLFNVDIQPCRGRLTDHFDPQSNTVFLSEATINSNGLGALAVATHEAGHAIQQADNYFMIKARRVLVPITNFASRLSFPLISIAILLEIFLGVTRLSNTVLAIALCFYGIYTLFLLVTLPVEFNASRRAIKLLKENNIIEPGEASSVKKVLSAAAQTYLASFAFSLLQLLRLVLVLLCRRDSK